MAFQRLFRKWPYLAALLGLIALAVVLAVRVRSQTTALVEVVTDQPLLAGHTMPDSSLARLNETSQAAIEIPRVEIPVDYYDFGHVSAQDVVRRDFLVINRGSAPLVILRAYTTCGCTTAELTASVIPPGKASRVTVVFNASFHPVAGETVRRGLVLETNDPSRPEAEIWVQASVGR